MQADINMGDYDKRTPLHVACAEGQLKAAKWLVDKGADIHTIGT
jgi:ankyrin repeat protein